MLSNTLCEVVQLSNVSVLLFVLRCLSKIVFFSYTLQNNFDTFMPNSSSCYPQKHSFICETNNISGLYFHVRVPVTAAMSSLFSWLAWSFMSSTRGSIGRHYLIFLDTCDSCHELLVLVVGVVFYELHKGLVPVTAAMSSLFSWLAWSFMSSTRGSRPPLLFTRARVSSSYNTLM
jgi:hypothetical protein